MRKDIDHAYMQCKNMHCRTDCRLW